MAEVSGPGPSIYQYNNSHYRDANSTASSISFLPPYGHGAYSKSTVTGCDSVTPPEEVFIANSSSQKIGLSTRCELPMTRTRSISNLTNQVGTGAGLDPGSVQQGRNAGFGLGYDLEENRKRDSRRDSDITLGNAIMTPPHSPMLRPSSVTLDDNGQVIGRGGILMPA
ncbi:hypothetical protein BGZ54_010126 [Gamsiella multidivaricata]|nr:hypothetical protein BGZ54_010126 [Gamsiella multidivaricata]